MFTFVREFRGNDAELFDILLAEGTVPDGAERFGEAVDTFGCGTAYHLSIGKLALFHAGEDRRGKQVRQLLTWHGRLTEAERDRLFLDVQMLLGGSLDSSGGMEPKHHGAGWWAADVIHLA
ncbi:hypothetical protein J8F10_24300 [Gemmata sp. G18]|uniref:Uncharacterized protein n=1 Tax=Gemmata palustris TaxID=2822762 RepID=A0ABS5BXJ1_9BACT|nr:hypothetical protein [Gemmata palustris]MBP3958383.1 hypothetical protein [Gemmata palustris]